MHAEGDCHGSDCSRQQSLIEALQGGARGFIGGCQRQGRTNADGIQSRANKQSCLAHRHEGVCAEQGYDAAHGARHPLNGCI